MSDYGIDLAHEIDNMSWRRFMILLNYLSPSSSFVSVMQNRQEKRNKGKRGKRTEAIADPDLAVRAVNNVWK